MQPGEAVSLTADGLESRQVVPAERAAHCVFEHIYFSRPDSRLEGRVLQEVRGRMGEILAREAPVDADLVISVPDSGNPAANGFARASRAAQGRRPDQEPLRAANLHPARAGAAQARPADEVQPAARDRRRASAWWSSTTRSCAATRPARSSGCCATPGASEVHLRISAPPIRHPCHYGVDMSTREEMVAHERTVEEIAAEVGADSLAYLSLEGVYEAVGTPREVHCDACFTGDYPLGDGGEANGKFALEQLPVVQARPSAAALGAKISAAATWIL